jgi:hypothetical protein
VPPVLADAAGAATQRAAATASRAIESQGFLDNWCSFLGTEAYRR